MGYIEGHESLSVRSSRARQLCPRRFGAMLLILYPRSPGLVCDLRNVGWPIKAIHLQTETVSDLANSSDSVMQQIMSLPSFRVFYPSTSARAVPLRIAFRHCGHPLH